MDHRIEYGAGRRLSGIMQVVPCIKKALTLEMEDINGTLCMYQGNCNVFAADD